MAVITVGINSWCTIAFADAYFESKWGASNWAALTNANKTILLIHAYNWIMQQLQLAIPASSTATTVKQAQCEAAWYIYNFFEDHEKRRALYTMGVVKFRVSKFSEDLQGAGFPDFILGMLDDYLTSIGGKIITVHRDYDNNT